MGTFERVEVAVVAKNLAQEDYCTEQSPLKLYGFNGDFSVLLQLKRICPDLPRDLTPVPRPADQAEFCAAVNDPQSTISLNQALAGVGGTFSILSCAFSGSVGTVMADLHLTTPVVMTVRYSVVFTFICPCA